MSNENISESVSILERAQKIHDDVIQEAHDEAQRILEEAKHDAQIKKEEYDKEHQERKQSLENLRIIESEYRSRLKELVEKTLEKIDLL